MNNELVKRAYEIKDELVKELEGLQLYEMAQENNKYEKLFKEIKKLSIDFANELEGRK
jgi:poly(A) polymerase Pap1